MTTVFSEDSQKYRDQILEMIRFFDSEGEVLEEGSRNQIKLFELNGTTLNIKSFKVPNAVNQVVYRFFRKSKAQRSYEYAQKLLQKEIGTPKPFAYIEKPGLITFGRSYYVSEQLDCDFTYREVIWDPKVKDRQSILRAFTRFTWELHEKQVYFLDHSPGNTLIKQKEGNYHFYLVDLNRMEFKNLTFEERMKNFSRLTSKKEVVKVMASEYAQLIGKPEAEVFSKMWFYTENFQKKFQKKRQLKSKFKLRK